ncbi:MAG: peptidoglycan DD-metalloendopeptidase family protein [Bacteroidetes bacterium]|nr:peptidoglycan DD-metalloendopeptidase family protein [Bacteroidota bacterium]
MKTILILISLQIAILSFAQESKIKEDLYFYSEPKPEYGQNCIPEIKFDPAIHQNITGPYNMQTVSFGWPLKAALDQGLIIVNYVDDLAGSGIKDYDNGNWSYEGHNGTDICLHDFRNMDRFYAVEAAESGTVVQTVMNNFDRVTEWGTGDIANFILIKHDDGSYAYYYHLMKKSVTVKLGEYVQKGKIIGYVGSSGYSTDAHLHFEPGFFVNGVWYKRDPWQGTYNHQASLWENQEAYAGDIEFTLHDMGVFTAGNVGGNIDHITSEQLKERIIQPVTVSGYESRLGFWMQYQGINTGKQVRYELRNSNGGLISSAYFNLSNQYQYSRSIWTPDFNPGVGVTGDWYVRVLYDNVEKGRCFFNVQLLTSNRPRMYPVAAKCFRRSLFVQRDTLRVRPVRSGMQYQLVNAPPNVTLSNDSILSIGAFDQPFRVYDFKVIASIGGSASLRDTMLYKLIDTTKNNSSGNGIVSLELKSFIEGRYNGTSMVEDTIDVLLRANLSPYLLVDYAKVLTLSNGTCIANFPNASSGVYFHLLIRHRNSIETWAKTVQQFPYGFPLSYDFTDARTKAFGDNQKYKGGEYCIYSGDINQDGAVDVTDVSLVDNDLSFFASGYVVTDLDGDNFVDTSDLAIAENNAFNYVVKIRP